MMVDNDIIFAFLHDMLQHEAAQYGLKEVGCQMFMQTDGKFVFVDEDSGKRKYFRISEVTEGEGNPLNL